MTAWFDTRQLQFRFPLESDERRGAFAVSESNATAVSQIDDWRRWPKGALLLVGPEASGKSHLAASWRTASGGVSLPGDRFDETVFAVLAEAPAASIEDIDRRRDDRALFHIVNAARETDTRLLLTARTAPGEWGPLLPDLATRLAAMSFARLAPPNDDLLKAVIAKHLRDRQIAWDDEGLLDDAILRIERSFDGARRFAEALDFAIVQKKKRINRDMIRMVARALESGGPDA
ncbi:MAG: hypothetical protein AAGL49_01710 [Pseudomonadota bacterium]